MSETQYEKAATRLSDALERMKFHPPGSNHLARSLAAYFCDKDIDYIERVSGFNKEPITWHFIELTKFSMEISRRHNRVNYATSLAAALSFIVDELDSAHIYPDEITVAGNTFEFKLNGNLLFRIGEIQFESVSESATHHVKSALKSIKIHNEGERLQKRLQKISGLEVLYVNCNETVKYSDTCLFTMAENLPVSMKRMLGDHYGIDVKIAQALELVAAAFGVGNWNTFQALINKHRNSLHAPLGLTEYNDAGQTTKFFRNAAEGIVAMANAVKTHPDHVSGQKILMSYVRTHKDYLSIDLVDNEILNDDITYIPPALSLSNIAEAFANKSTLDTFRPLNDMDITEAAAWLRKYLKISESFLTKIQSSNQRQGLETTVIKNTLFTRSEGFSGIMRIQRLDDKHGAVNSLEAAAVVLYKAKIRIKDGIYTLLGDYGNEHAWTFDGFDPDEIQVLSKFSGLRVENF